MATFSYRHLAPIYCFIGLYCLSLPSSWAQSVAAQTAKTQSNISFTVFAPDRLNGLYFLPKAGDKPRPLSFSSQSKSPVYTYTGSSELTFYNLVTPVGTSPKTSPSQAPIEPTLIPVARLVIPEGASRLLILFFPEKNQGGSGALSYRLFPINDSFSNLIAEHVVILNASGREYAAAISDQKVFLKAGLSGPYKVGQKAVLQFAAQLGERWVSAGVREFDLGENARSVVVLFPPTVSGSIAPNVRILTDAIPSPTSDKASPLKK
jgi:hypothetical protein